MTRPDLREHGPEIRLERSLSTGLWDQADWKKTGSSQKGLTEKKTPCYILETQILLLGRIKSNLKLRRGSEI